jgi:hypothetical protein
MTKKSVLVAIAAFSVLLVLMALPVAGSPLVGVPVAQPSPRPTLTPPAQPPPRPTLTPPGWTPPEPRDTGDDGDSGLQSAITGYVTDLSSGQSGRGIKVSVNGDIVTTDSDGHYSITGLGAGEYTVSLVLPGEWLSAQDPVSVHLDGQNSVTVDLAYYSQPPATPTPSPAPPTLPPPPVELPQTGGP